MDPDPPPSNVPVASAAGIFQALADANRPKEITILGVCPNLMVSIHKDEACGPCASYAHHMNSEVASKATLLTPIPVGVLTTALETSFPEHVSQQQAEMKRLRDELS